MTRRAVPDPRTYAALTRDALAADKRAALAAVDARYTQGGITYAEWFRFRGEVERRATDASTMPADAPHVDATGRKI